jgi:hypothetical protein
MDRRVIGLFVIALMVGTSAAHAAWTPFAVSQAPGTQQYPLAATDGAGGAIVAWIDDRSGSQEIYVQRVRASDAVDPSWPANGLLVGPAYYDQTIVADGAGGAILVVAESATDIRAYHVQASGVLDPAWPAGGVVVRTGASNQEWIRAVPDGAGGAVVTWSDERNSATTGTDLYAQRVRSTGVTDPAWPVNGAPVYAGAGDQVLDAAVSDGSGGIIALFEDNRSAADYDVYAQRMLATGTVDPSWPAGGRQLCGEVGNQGSIIACSDGAGGAIAAWNDPRNNSSDIYAMRVQANGHLGTGWTHDGELVLAAIGSDYLYLNDIVPDGSGGAVMVWGNSSDSNVLAQKITSSGTISWTPEGVEVCVAPVDQVGAVLAQDGSGGVYVAWEDGRYWSDQSYLHYLFLHHVLSSGSPDPAWPVDGGRASFAGLPYFPTALVPNGSGGATVIWGDGANDLYAMNLTSTWTPPYGLLVSGAPIGAGSVGKNPDLPSYAANSNVALTAVPGTGHTFIAWSGDASGSTNPLTVTMNATKSITAIFDGFAVDVSASPSGAGSVAKNPDQALYLPGSQVTLTASPTTGYGFASWSGDTSGTANPVTITVNGPKSITGNFSLLPPSCGNWSPITGATLPSARVGAPLAWDPVRHRVLMFGGYDGTFYLNDVWQFTVAAGWTQLTPVGSPPSVRDEAGLIYDPLRDRLLVVAGNNDTPPNDVWQLTLGATPTWSQLTPAGTPPSGRFAFSTIYDPIRDRVILFGGYPNTNTVWSLSLAGTPTWTQLSPSGSAPAPRYGHVAIYDPVRDRMLIHGGSNTSAVYSDTWALALGGPLAWTAIAGSGAAPQVYLSAGIYDPIRDRMLVVAGLTSVGGVIDDHVWSLSLEVQPFWTQIPAGGVPLEARYFHCGVYEPELDLLLTFEGIGNSGYLGDGRRLDCAGGWWLQTGGAHGTVTPSPSKVCYGNGELVSLQAVGQPGYHLLQWLGDASGSDNPLMDVAMNDNKTIVAQFSNVVGVEEAPLAFALEAIHPNPNPGSVQVTYTLPQAARVRLGIYDLAGREVGRLADGVVPAGRHVAAWDGRVGGSPATSGIYFVRFETPAGTWVRRVVRIH